MRAAQLGDEELDRCIVAGQSVLIETVLSSDKFRHRVQAAKDAGFSVTLIYVTLRLAALNVQRVDQRHDLGGHAVPPDRIVARRARSHANFAWFASAADRVLLFDNTDQAGPVFVAGCEAGEWDIVAIERLPRDLYRAVRKLAGLSKR